MPVTMPPRLVCLGNLTIDDVVLPDRTEKPGCTGGDALYACLAARLFEPASEMVAPVGNDWPDNVKDQIREAGLSDLGLPPRDLPSLHNRVDYDHNGGRAWTLYNGEQAFDILSPAPEDIPELYSGTEAFLVLAMTLTAQIGLVTALRRDRKAIIALDPQEDYIAGNEDALKALIAQCDIFMPSAEEVRRLLHHDDWSAAARYFADLGPAIVVIKLGAEGSLIFDKRNGQEIRVPALQVDTVDTTGAGDSFCGAFMAAFLQDREDLEAAARAGGAAASFTVAGYGVEPLFAATADMARARLANWQR
jgi:sugar/nucleoside kinase (ribokinase family)